MMEYGALEGETCNRRGCKGVIKERAVENCSCHISPPCSACTAPRAYCPVCDWDEADDVVINDHVVNADKSTGNYRFWTERPLDATKIDWRKEGVYPEGTTRAEVEELVRGTFGGRFEQFDGGKFKYIAYTD